MPAPRRVCLIESSALISTLENLDDFRSPIKSKNAEDRFIPQRNTPASKELFRLSHKDNSPSDVSSYTELEKDKLLYTNLVEQKMLNFDKMYEECMQKGQRASEKNFKAKRPKLLQFSQKKENSRNVLPTSIVMDDEPMIENDLVRTIKYSRRIPKVPVKVLDAPGIADDFYQDILDWSLKDVVAIGLNNCIYLCNNRAKENSVVKLAEIADNFYSTLKFSPSGDLIAAGEESGDVYVFDPVKETELFHIQPHASRICSISWQNENILSTGSRDRTIKNLDLRTKSFVSNLQKHSQEVCGLRWSPEENFLASGGNENHIYVWDIRK